MKFSLVCKFKNCQCQSDAVFEVSTISTNTCCETATPLAYCCDYDQVVHLSPFSSAICLSTTTTTTTTTQRHNYIFIKKSGSGVVVKFNYWFGNCQHNSCAK